ncbi:MAG: ferredoxin [Nanoarchaeota archaeon]
MTPFKIIHHKQDCISCGACAAIQPEFWEMDERGLAHLKSSVPVNSHWERSISTEEERAANQEAADCCPVNIIKVENFAKQNSPARREGGQLTQ